MIFPMRRFNMNVTEVFLSDLGNVFAILLILLAILVAVFSSWFEADGFWGGVLADAMIAAGLLLGLGSGGIRQNRSVLEMALAFMLFTGLGWLVYGIVRFAPLAILLGLAVLLMLFTCWVVRREGVRARFTPRFFSLRQFETMVQIADAMLDGDDLALHPVEVALRADHFLAEVDSPVKQDIRRVMFLVEWLSPLLVLRPFPFSDLGTHERREIIRKVIWSRGLFRDVARTLKLLSTFPYYTHPEARAGLGYVDFDARERARDLDQTPKTYPPPAGTAVRAAAPAPPSVEAAETPAEPAPPSVEAAEKPAKPARSSKPAKSTKRARPRKPAATAEKPVEPVEPPVEPSETEDTTE